MFSPTDKFSFQEEDIMKKVGSKKVSIAVKHDKTYSFMLDASKLEMDRSKIDFTPP